MAKRFTETAKWADKWFRGLSPLHKLAWNYLCDNCDAAGVIELDEALADFQIGERVSWGELCDLAGPRIERLDSDKLWITKFVEFQYGSLSESCPPHKPAIASLRKHQLAKVLNRYAIPIGKALDKEKEKDKTKIPTLVEVQAYCDERQNGIDPQEFLDHYDACGWVQGKSRKPITSWKAAIRTWEANRRKQRQGPRLATQKELSEWSPN